MPAGPVYPFVELEQTGSGPVIEQTGLSVMLTIFWHWLVQPLCVTVRVSV